MGMKSALYMMTTLALAMMPGQNSNHSMPSGMRVRETNFRKEEDGPLPEDVIKIKNPYKGNTVEKVDFLFNWQNAVLKINCEIAYGNERSRLKAFMAKQGFLAEYIKTTDLKKIIAHRQFIVKFESVEQIINKPRSIETKGDYEGRCNRTACVTELPAVYFNHSTRKYYCKICADLINKVNPESQEMYGSDLCTLVLKTETLA